MNLNSATTHVIKTYLQSPFEKPLIPSFPPMVFGTVIAGLGSSCPAGGFSMREGIAVGGESWGRGQVSRKPFSPGGGENGSPEPDERRASVARTGIAHPHAYQRIGPLVTVREACSPKTFSIGLAPAGTKLLFTEVEHDHSPASRIDRLCCQFSIAETTGMLPLYRHQGTRGTHRLREKS